MIVEVQVGMLEVVSGPTDPSRLDIWPSNEII